MPLDDVNTVDAVGLENNTECAVLTIADSWEWNNVRAHLIALQNKINAYFGFIESGQLLDAYPAAQGRQLVIDVIFRFPPSHSALELLAKAAIAAADLNVLIRHRTIPDTCDTT